MWSYPNHYVPGLGGYGCRNVRWIVTGFMNRDDTFTVKQVIVAIDNRYGSWEILERQVEEAVASFDPSQYPGETIALLRRHGEQGADVTDGMIWRSLNNLQVLYDRQAPDPSLWLVPDDIHYKVVELGVEVVIPGNTWDKGYGTTRGRYHRKCYLPQGSVKLAEGIYMLPDETIIGLERDYWPFQAPEPGSTRYCPYKEVLSILPLVCPWKTNHPFLAAEEHVRREMIRSQDILREMAEFIRQLEPCRMDVVHRFHHDRLVVPGFLVWWHMRQNNYVWYHRALNELKDELPAFYQFVVQLYQLAGRDPKKMADLLDSALS